MKISILHPSRSRVEKSVNTIDTWLDRTSSSADIQLIVSVDDNDPQLELYKQAYNEDHTLIVNKNRSCVDAINNAAKIATGDILIVVSDDTDCKVDWDVNLLVQVKGSRDWCLKTNDGIQDYIITMPCLDRDYYNRFGYIYHPDFLHMFCDTYMTCVADITGRKFISHLDFPHLNSTIKDDLRKRTDGTWQQGQDTFIRLMKQFSKADIQKIQDRQMIRFLRNNGVQV
jgi:glycosyltransferase involved in cell wall biosynthesis